MNDVPYLPAYDVSSVLTSEPRHNLHSGVSILLIRICHELVVSTLLGTKEGASVTSGEVFVTFNLECSASGHLVLCLNGLKASSNSFPVDVPTAGLSQHLNLLMNSEKMNGLREAKLHSITDFLFLFIEILWKWLLETSRKWSRQYRPVFTLSWSVRYNIDVEIVDATLMNGWSHWRRTWRT